MKTSMMIKTPREFFEKVLPSKFNSSKAAGLEAVIQMNITGSERGNWTITVKDQKMEVNEGIHPSPDIAVKIADTDFVDLINGKTSAMGAFMTRKLEFKGSISLGLKLTDIGIM